MADRIGVAFSGGIDSTAVVLMLLSKGYNIFGLHMLLSNSPAGQKQAERALVLAQRLGIDCSIIDMVEDFTERVVQPFCAEYSIGRTPNPCVVCNREMKFGLLLEAALNRGADKLATGHYVRTVTDGQSMVMQCAMDRQADQSYFLYAVAPELLRYLETPLGNILRTRVHAMVQALALPEAKSSQDICFLSGGDLQRFLTEQACPMPGDVVDREGHVLGQHAGLPFYTVGQRHGLGISRGQPLYVVRLDAQLNRVVVGSHDELLCSSARVTHVRWLSSPIDQPFESQARVRHRSPLVPVYIMPAKDTALVHFRTPQHAVAPGQSIVFYNGDTVLGGGVILKTAVRDNDAD